MKVLDFSKSSAGYKIRIWLDETKFDPQGNPYEEWVWSGTWGLDAPLNTVEDIDEDGEPKLDGNGKPLYKQVAAMTQEQYQKSIYDEAIRQAQEVLDSTAVKNEQVSLPQES